MALLNKRDKQSSSCVFSGRPCICCHTLVLVECMLLQEGMRGFYKGWAANTLKVVPQNSIRFVAYELLKGFMGVKKAKTDT